MSSRDAEHCDAVAAEAAMAAASTAAAAALVAGELIRCANQMDIFYHYVLLRRVINLRVKGGAGKASSKTYAALNCTCSLGA